MTITISRSLDYSRDYERSKDYAERNGLTLKTPGPLELFCDLDTEDDLNRFLVTAGKLQTAKIISTFTFVFSKSGKSWHGLVYTTKPLDVFQKIALQAILGSDRRRELAAFTEAFFGKPETAIRRFAVAEEKTNVTNA